MSETKSSLETATDLTDSSPLSGTKKVIHKRSLMMLATQFSLSSLLLLVLSHSSL